MKTIYLILIASCSLITIPAHSQKNAGTAVPNMGKTYTRNSPQNVPGTYYNATKTATVVTDTGKSFTVASKDITAADTDFYKKTGYVAYSTPAKDTLFLQDDTMGLLIKQIWDQDKKYAGKKPTIVMVPNLAVVVMAHKPKEQKQIIQNKNIKN